MEKLLFKLPVFEGPLDLLLFLIQKNKLNIYDIPISELLDQYMAYLNSLSDMDLEVTSEFLEMASRLVQIKSALLLPKHEQEEEDDPRRELVSELIKLKTCKEMAAALQARSDGFNCFIREPAKIDRDQTYHITHKADELLKAYRVIADKVKRRLPPPVSAFRGVVGRKVVSVGSRIIHVVKRLCREGEQAFSALFEDSTARSELVATFLAVLELIKSKRIVIVQSGGREVVRMARGVSKWKLK